MRNERWLWVISLLTLCLVPLGCDDDDDGRACLGEPRHASDAICDGRVGSSCSYDRDCYDQCCRGDHCGPRGMCTLSCRGDRDCPLDMLCEHSVCLFACDSDYDCGPGFRCEHGHRVCEAN